MYCRSGVCGCADADHGSRAVRVGGQRVVRPNVNAAAILLAPQGNVPVEATAS
jgi:hypothetical protein